MSESHGAIGAIEDQVAETVRRSFRSSAPGLYPLTRDAPLTGEQAVERLPASIRIGPYEFEIEKMSSRTSASRARYGECNTQEQRIAVATDLASAAKAVDTFLHEALHGCWWVMSLENGDTQERVVCSLAVAMTSLYRDNPWLLDWLKECLR